MLDTLDTESVGSDSKLPDIETLVHSLSYRLPVDVSSNLISGTVGFTLSMFAVTIILVAFPALS